MVQEPQKGGAHWQLSTIAKSELQANLLSRYGERLEPRYGDLERGMLTTGRRLLISLSSVRSFWVPAVTAPAGRLWAQARRRLRGGRPGGFM